MTDSNKLVLTAIIGILVGLIIGRMMWFKTVPSDNALDTEESATTTLEGGTSWETTDLNSDVVGEETIKPEVKADGVISVAAGDQKAGDVASVSVTTDKLVWVAVRDDNNGAVGKILGARRYGPGSAVIEIGLYRNTEAGKSYYVTLTDDKAGEMNYAASAILSGADSKPLTAVFTATK